jgi:hypothetical protein
VKKEPGKLFCLYGPYRESGPTVQIEIFTVQADLFPGSVLKNGTDPGMILERKS